MAIDCPIWGVPHQGGVQVAKRRKTKYLDKGRVLRDGESERPKESRFMYRYRDIHGKVRYIYAQTLDELRVLEDKVRRDLDDGIDYAAGEATVLELVTRYLGLKQNVRNSTLAKYKVIMNLLEKEPFSQRQIRMVNQSDGKNFFIKLQKDGRGYSTMTGVRGVLYPAFEMAVNDDIIRRNPFSFKLSEVVRNNSTVRKALTPDEQKRLLDYIQEDKYRSKHYDEIVILLGTGMRVSELCGLTRADIDFDKCRIRVERQLIRNRVSTEHELFIEKTKTKSGERFIPMSQEVCQAFQRVIQNRKTPKIEHVIGGHTGFLFLDRAGKPKVADNLEHSLKYIVDQYNESHPDKLTVTPHVLRHTFCTNMANTGLDAKPLQYLMGHANVRVTLNTYTHASYESAEMAMGEIVNMAKAPHAGSQGVPLPEAN